AHRGAVDLPYAVREPGRRQLLLARVEGEALQDLGAGVEELLMELLHRCRMFEDDFRGEGARLHVPALLQFEEVPSVAEHGPLVEALEDPTVPRGPPTGRGPSHHMRNVGAG